MSTLERLNDLIYFVLLAGSSAANVGPAWPATGLRRLGPERRKSLSGLSLRSMVRPTKQLLISSQFCKPQRTSFFGSGLNALLAELSKCEMAIRRVPLGSEMGSLKS